MDKQQVDPEQPDNIATFRELMLKCTPAQKHSMMLILSESIKQDRVEKSTPNRTINFSDFVEVVTDALPSNYFDEAIIAEVESMGLNSNSRKPQSQWLSFEKSDYCFSDNHRLKHPSKTLADFPATCKLMESINELSATTQDADSVLVIVYNCDDAGIGYHNDGESLIDSDSSITTVTFGSSRDIAFCDQAVWPPIPQHSVTCHHHDVMVMKPGCQETLAHHVRRGTGVSKAPPTAGLENGRRIVSSFRKKKLQLPASSTTSEPAGPPTDPRST